ncbi:MAG: hypothetical protein AAGI66_06180 [Cyanobacteria bacterium P01_H01_bin.74]
MMEASLTSANSDSASNITVKKQLPKPSKATAEHSAKNPLLVAEDDSFDSSTSSEASKKQETVPTEQVSLTVEDFTNQVNSSSNQKTNEPLKPTGISRTDRVLTAFSTGNVATAAIFGLPGSIGAQVAAATGITAIGIATVPFLIGLPIIAAGGVLAIDAARKHKKRKNEISVQPNNQATEPAALPGSSKNKGATESTKNEGIRPAKDGLALSDLQKPLLQEQKPTTKKSTKRRWPRFFSS